VVFLDPPSIVLSKWGKVKNMAFNVTPGEQPGWVAESLFAHNVRNFERPVFYSKEELPALAKSAAISFGTLHSASPEFGKWCETFIDIYENGEGAVEWTVNRIDISVKIVVRYDGFVVKVEPRKAKHFAISQIQNIREAKKLAYSYITTLVMQDD
jgi:hypothetical protein